MKKIIKAGATDQTIDIFIQNSSSTTGAGLTGLVFNSSGLKCYYRKGATGSATQLTLATQTVGGAHSDGGFVEIDATNMPGVYRLDLSDTIVASAGTVTLMLSGATNMAPLPIELQVVAVDLEDGTSMGVSRIDAAVSSRASQTSLDTLDDYVDTEVAAIKAKTDQLTFSTANRVDSQVFGMEAGTVTAAAVATGAIDADALAADAGTELADAMLARDIGSGSNAGSLNERTVRSALRFLRNKWSISGTTLTVTEEDDSTTAWTATVTPSAGADPITGNDPA